MERLKEDHVEDVMQLGLGRKAEAIGDRTDTVHHLIRPVVAWCQFPAGLVSDARC